MIPFHRSHSLRGPAIALAALLIVAACPASESPAPRLITLEDCIELALRRNRELQIERLNPAIARANLSAAYSWYDPVFTVDYQHETDTDLGGFDPTDLSRDAIYDAEADVLRVGMTGFLPTGLSYTLTGSYANTFGERNQLNFDSYSTFAGIVVRQPLLRNFWIDQGRFLIRVNRKLVEMSELGVAFLALDVILRVEQAWYEFLYATEYHEVQSGIRNAVERSLHGLERRVQQGVLTEAETLSTRAQLASIETTLLAASNSVVLAENNLKTLIGDDFISGVPLRPVERLWVTRESFDLPQSWRRGLEHRPDLAQLRTDVERSDIEVRFRRNQLFPSLDVVAGYGRRGASTSQVLPPLTPRASAGDAFDQLSDGDAPQEMIGVIFTMPLGRVAERANYRASRHLRNQAELRVRQREELVLREIADAVMTAQISLQRVEAAETASRYAAQALAAEERKLAGGASSIFFVLQLQNDLLAARAAEIRAKADYLQAVAQLHFAEGTLLDRHGVRITFQ